MAKQLKFTYNGKDYVLEYNRRTVAEMERMGFVPAEVKTKPVSMLPALFQGAFMMHHRREKKETIDAIFAHMTNKDKLIEELVDMYSEPIVSMIEEPEESKGNVNWTVSG